MSASVADRAVPGGWSDREVALGPHRFRLLTPSEPDALLDYLESPEATSQPHLVDPYWAKVWPAAPLLAAAIVGNPPPRGTSVLEIGCGSGLVGIAALASGTEVTFSDYVPLAVELAIENARRNGFANARGFVLDWRQPGSEEQFGFIVAADVTYDRTDIEALLNVLDQRLKAGGTAWFGDAGRGPAGEFLQRATDRGWRISLFDQDDQPVRQPELGKYCRMVLRRDQFGRGKESRESR
jgi:predicted nicotinamide N-methyase